MQLRYANPEFRHINSFFSLPFLTLQLCSKLLTSRSLWIYSTQKPWHPAWPSSHAAHKHTWAVLCCAPSRILYPLSSQLLSYSNWLYCHQVPSFSLKQLIFSFSLYPIGNNPSWYKYPGTEFPSLYRHVCVCFVLSTPLLPTGRWAPSWGATFHLCEFSYLQLGLC